MDTDGSGYGRIGAPGDEDRTLQQTGFGTPMGELLRRYWQPVCLSAELGDLPRRIRILGEDLVAFRDGAGRAGLLYAHCIHRGASLEFGQIAEGGIRCCYHGWYFDAEGRCLDMPAEPPESDYRNKVRQPWYPVREYHGLVFAYMGPPDRVPAFPTYDILDDPDGERIAYRNFSRGEIAACNWLQLQENAIDAAHLFILHTWHHGMHEFTDAYGERPDLAFERTDSTVRYHREAVLANGNRFLRVGEVLVPTARSIAAPTVTGDDPEGETEPARMIGWWVPVDDVSTVGFHIEVQQPRADGTPRKPYQPQGVPERPYEERQRMPDDWEAQIGQGAMASHAREHLATSDMGIVHYRRLLQDGLMAIARGDDPPGVVRTGGDRRVHVAARNEVARQAAGAEPAGV
ncbi:MAG: Rieske 2Fe-2S domain-containing protein [Rhodospirillaceae bacterium]